MIVTRKVILDMIERGWRIAGYVDYEQDIGIAKYLVRKRCGYGLDCKMFATRLLPSGDILVDKSK